MNRKVVAAAATGNERKRRKRTRNIIDAWSTRIDERDSKVIDTIKKLHDEEFLRWNFDANIKVTEDENHRVCELSWGNCERDKAFFDEPEDVEEDEYGAIPLPECILRLDALERLRITTKKVRLPQWIDQFENLKELELGDDGYGAGESFDLSETITLPDAIGNLKSLETLKLYLDGALVSLPKTIGNLANLAEFESNSSLRFLPDDFGHLTNLKKIVLGFSHVSSLPTTIGSLSNLEYLELTGNENLLDLPDEIGNLTSLKTLSLRDCELRSLPSSIGRLTKLRKFELCGVTTLSDLPDEFGNLTSLETLVLENCAIASLPTSIGNLTNLKELRMSCAISSVPISVGNLTNLEVLELSCSGIQTLPEEIRGLVNLKRLYLNNAEELHSLPEGLGSLVNLEFLELPYSGIQSLPEAIRGLVNLKRLHLSRAEELHSLPEGLGGLANLELLGLSSSGIQSLPSSIFDLANLKELNLDGTKQLKALPANLKNLHRLECLSLNRSGITGIPSGLVDLKNLRFLYLSEHNLGIENTTLLSELLKQCPRLECLGHSALSPSIRCSLLRNGMRSRIFFPGFYSPRDNTEWSAPPLSLWSQILNRTGRQMYNICGNQDFYLFSGFDQLDMIFWLLVDNGDTILSRARKASSSTAFCSDEARILPPFLATQNQVSKCNITQELQQEGGEEIKNLIR